MDSIFEELGIPKKYLKHTSRDDRFIALVHRNWLRSLLKHSKLIEVTEKCKLEIWDDCTLPWTKIIIRIFKKRDVKVIPLPRMRSNRAKEDSPLLFPQLLQYISQTNYKNLWKEAYKKYGPSDTSRTTQVTLTDYNDVLREIIVRTYGCRIVNTCDAELSVEESSDFDAHCNLFPAACAVETLNAIFLLHTPQLEHSLSDCVNFSPSLLEACHAKPMFLVYQLIHTLKSLHERSLTVGDITLDDIYLSNDLWLLIFPQIHSNIYVQEIAKGDSGGYDCRKSGHKYEGGMKCLQCGARTYDKVQIGNESLEKLCELWVNGQISNYTYLMSLNNLSGRKYSDPNCHYVFPWVSDFATRFGKNWRDLKKSKFRLNKGDRQLDLTYEHSQSQVPHHVTDVLSSITYYVYMARRTPKSVLCKNVRTNWVPAEYPSSIQRLQEWTPDECIPEFFSDPSVFRSVHDDLDDLEVPDWCSGPEDFVEVHREALESLYVSERLHQWIDLTFGYKLAGHAATKAKNVCLHLVDGHTNLTSSGVVQLFFHPHPARATNLPFWGKTPPKLQYSQKQSKSTSEQQEVPVTPLVESVVRIEEDDTTLDEDLSLTHSGRSPMPLSRLLSRSRSSLNEDAKEQRSRNSSMQRSASLGPKNANLTPHTAPKKTSINTGTTIILPKEFNPAQALNNLENLHTFFTKTFHTSEGKRYATTERPEESTTKNRECPQNAFTNHLFEPHRRATKSFTFPIDNQNVFRSRSRTSPTKLDNQISCNYAEIVAIRRTRELQILGCLTMEIFMPKQLRALGYACARNKKARGGFKERIRACLTILSSCKNEIPNCVRALAQLLLQPDGSDLDAFKYPTITQIGLPPPTAHLLLEPLLHTQIPFNENLPELYKILRGLKEYDCVVEQLNILCHFDCNGTECAEYEEVERARVLFLQNISECKIKTCASNLERLLENINAARDSNLISLLVPYIKFLIEDAPTSVLAAWYLFDPIARLLGPKKSSEVFLDPILKLYETDNDTYNSKIAKIYHHSFLLRVIVRFGLRCFLEFFITPLVEAVGGYRDGERPDCILHTHSPMQRKTSHLKMIDNEIELSPAGDDSSGSEQTPPKTVREPELFEFEGEMMEEEEAKPPVITKSLIEHLELNIAASDLPFNHSGAEEALDATLTNVEDEYGGGLMSPTIPIPLKLAKDFANISCDVGSKKSESDYLMDGKRSDLNYFEISSNYSRGSNRLQRNDANISSMSSDSLIWLSHRLGPVLTARYLSRNLLKMLTLCYVGRENLVAHSLMDSSSSDGLDFISIACSRVVGDRNAAKVLECLSSIAALYGEQLILLQYLPHMSELIALCKRKLTANLEGGLISCLALLKHIIPYISDATLMDQLQDVILKNILHPTIRLLGSTKYTFPNGSIARNVLARKYLDTLYVLALRMGADMTRTHLAVPALQRFFLIFDKIGDKGCFKVDDEKSQTGGSTHNRDSGDEHFVELRRDGTTTEWAIGGRPVQISHVRLRDSDSTDSLSPPIMQNVAGAVEESVLNQALDELRSVFTPDLAHTAYMPFLRQIGLQSLESSLRNHHTVHSLCQEYEQELQNTYANYTQTDIYKDNSSAGADRSTTGSLGSNVAVIGNRIDVQDDQDDVKTVDVLSYISNKMENNVRHLRGNWLAYWEHEIGRSDKDTMFNFKQIKLQTFAGHTNGVKALHVLDNENSFLSGSRDKTVKLWSLRSQGDGTNVTSCQSTYTAHKKSVLSIGFLESLRLVASCDSAVHLWDPFMGAAIGQLESSRFAPVNVLKCLPAPSSLLFAATTEGTLRVIDARICSYIHELKVSASPTALIRCLAVAPSGVWIAMGQSSGQITVLDTRTGLVTSTWRAHESELLQLVALNENTLISSSLDQSVSAWNVLDGRFQHHMKGASEPVHCLHSYNDELISGTTANRIGVHTGIGPDSSFSSTKLRSDAFKGVLTAMAVLPLNRLLLLGADTGTVNLLC